MRKIIRWIIYFTTFIFLAVSLYYLPFASLINYLAIIVEKYPTASPLMYVLLVIVGIILFLPGSIAMMVSGFLFGFSQGVLFAVIGISLGSQAAFESGRRIARPWVKKKIAASERIQAIELALQEKAFVIIALTRLSLIIPFNILNYIYGASPVKSSIHFIATIIGMLPAITLYVYLGTFARDINQILSKEAPSSDLGDWVIFAGIILIIITTWVIHKAASKALEKHVSD
tara:strand:+ start:2311 stop:3000 length:690 start_codon:yes stop_codon:yes gene_type:complete